MKYPWLKGDYADVGHQNVADGLTALRRLVFEQHVLSMDEVLTALKDDFDGHEEVRQLLRGAPKYGNDDDYADEMFNRVRTTPCGSWLSPTSTESRCTS